MTTLTEQESGDSFLGQFIPLHYHHNMLMDQNRMKNFKAAIEYVVKPGYKVMELGGGTGVLSWFAAAAGAEKVWCVEYNPELVKEARRLLALNKHGDKVEVVHANAFEYLPPEPVDAVICEMIHVAMLREKQVEMMESFKRRYRERFGADIALPTLIPTAVVMAAQPLHEAYDFEGYQAPIIQFQQVPGDFSATTEMADPSVYSIMDFTEPTSLDIAWEGDFVMKHSNTVNAVRVVTKNILAIVAEKSTTIDWLNHYLALPLNNPVKVNAGDTLRVSFKYRAGDTFAPLLNSLKAEVV
ncbi:MAG: methyltransferase domain-containing protein [Methylophilales bacterium]|nr:methyltransferase domain-containing protein [Methylophilales bacterium]